MELLSQGTYKEPEQDELCTVSHQKQLSRKMMKACYVQA